jgi:hypothetical protein
VNDSLASGNPMRSNLPIRIRGSDSSALKIAKRRLDEPLLMVRKCMDAAFAPENPAALMGQFELFALLGS